MENDDYRTLLRNAGRIRKLLADMPVDIKIAVLGSCSVQYFVQVLRYMLYEDGIAADIYEGSFDGIKTDILDESSALYAFRPDILIILPDYRDLHELPGPGTDIKGVEQLAEIPIEEYKNLWSLVKSRLPETTILQGNFVIPTERILGNLEANYAFSRDYFFKTVNTGLTVQHPEYVTIVDMEYLASFYGKENWFDHTLYSLSKVPFSLRYIGNVAAMYEKLIAAWRGKIKKCIVLDLDNTLWGGIVAEEGFDGIRTDGNDAVGGAYLAFQRYLKALKDRGILLAVCSKNDEEIARQPFEQNKQMVLSYKDFASFVANWEDKATNLKRIAQEINIGLDSMVFFDDNPAERAIVKENLPEVTVIDVPEDPAYYIDALDRARLFEWLQLTKEDYTRAESYEKNRERRMLQETALDYDAYLKSLDMRAVIDTPDPVQLKRFAQLINKSNQFNLRTKRYLEPYVESLNEKPEYGLIGASLKDKFSDYGLIACIILHKQDTTCFIDTFVMSCRVLKRGLEYLVFQHIYDWAKRQGCEQIVGEYIPTEKNGLVKELYPQLGFQKLSGEQASMEPGVIAQVPEGQKTAGTYYQYPIGSRPKYNIQIKE